MMTDTKIDKVTIYPIPFVDRDVPLPSQQKLNWVKNGECPTGATNVESNDGVLNRPGVQIQTNVNTLNLNDHTQVDKINELVDNVNQINDNLADIGDISIITQVEENRQGVETLTNIAVDHSIRLIAEEAATVGMKEQIGVHNPEDPTTRPIYDEMFWQKKEMGSYPGFDINGIPNPESIGSGMKYRISNNESVGLSNTGRIELLEERWNESEVGELVDNVAKLRNELGPEIQAVPGSPVYERISINEAAIAEIVNVKIANINLSIDSTNEHTMKDRMEAVEASNEHNDEAIGDADSGLIKDVNDLKAKVGDTLTAGTLVYDVSQNKAKITEMSDILGDTSSDGIRGQIVTINNQIGTDAIPGSIEGRLKINSENLTQLQNETLTLKATVGNNTSGLVAAVSHIGKDMYGDAAATDPVLQNGVLATTETLVQQMASAVSDAPDTNYYARTQGNWIKLPNAKGSFEKDINVTLAEVGTEVSIDTSNASTGSFTPVQIVHTGSDLVINDTGAFQIISRTYVTTKTADSSYKVEMYVNGGKVAEQVRWAIGHNNEDIFTIDKIVNLGNASNTVEFKLTGLHASTVGETPVHIEIVVVAA